MPRPNLPERVCPKLQVGGQVVTFLTQHLGNPIPSPALFKQIDDRFREVVWTFAETNNIPCSV